MGAATFRKRVAAAVEAMVAEAQAEVADGDARFRGLEKAKRFSVWHATKRPKGRKVGRNAQARRRVDAAAKGRLGAMLLAMVIMRVEMASSA
jgi:phytoene/squalene synthetase